MALVICLPSHRRPHMLARVLADAARLGTAETTRIEIMIDDDDPTIADYMRLKLPPCAVLLPTKNRGKVAGSMNATMRANPAADCYGLLCDDVVLHTPNWDTLLCQAAGNCNIAYPDDLYQRERLCTFPFVGGDLARAVGWFALPGTARIYMDTAWKFIGERYGLLRYCPHVVIENLCPQAGKGVRDETYRKPEAESDKAVYKAWRENYATDQSIVDLAKQEGRRS